MVGAIRTRRRPPRHRVGEPFLRGPIPFAWWASACRLPGCALHVASVVRFRAGREGCDGIRLGFTEVERELGVKEDTARRGLRALAGAGLVAVAYPAGSRPEMSVLEAAHQPEAEPGRRPLYGPIPWSWWAAAARLPGRSLQVASALWLLVGWSRGQEPEFTFGLAEWVDLGLSRFSADRGLRALELAGLVTVARSDGRKARVAVQEARRSYADPDGDSPVAPYDLAHGP
jgi:DNA-binding transcriptional ArsR family regulator